MTGGPVRWGILGAGRIARDAFLPALQEASGAELEAVASRELERARAFGAPRVYASYAELLADPDVEAVYVATHNGLHKELALQAFEQGKHVLSEKPLACDAAECEEMIAAARKHDRLLVEAFMYRHHPQIARARELVEQGSIGELRTVEASFSFHMTRPDDVRLRREWGGGALLDVGCYCVSFARLFLGNEPRRIVALARFHPEHDVDLSLHGVLDYGGGLFAVISCGFDGGLRQRCVLTGTDGTITLPEPFLSFKGQPSVILRTGERTERFELGPINTFRAEIEDFSRAVRGAAAPLLAAEEGLLNARILDALLAAARAREDGAD